MGGGKDCSKGLENLLDAFSFVSISNRNANKLIIIVKNTNKPYATNIKIIHERATVVRNYDENATQTSL